MKRAVSSLAVSILLSAAAVHAQQVPLVPSHAPGPKAPRPGAAASVVARVNGVAVTETAVQREMQKLFPFAGVHGNRIPGNYSVEIRRQAIQQAVWEELLHQEALRRKLVAPAAMLKDLLSQAQGRFPSRAAYEAYATREFGGVRSFEQHLRRGLLIAVLLDQEVTQKARVTEAEVQDFYARNRKRFLKPASVWLQTITIHIPNPATESQRAWARKRAEDVLRLAKTTKNYEAFGRLAETHSQDDWRVMMGDRRWVHRGRLSAAVEAAAFGLKPGEVSGLISASDGLVIVRVNATQPQTEIPYAQLREQLRDDLQKAKETRLRGQIEARLRSTFKVESL
jgi:hypothetical protein